MELFLVQFDSSSHLKIIFTIEAKNLGDGTSADGVTLLTNYMSNATPRKKCCRISHFVQHQQYIVKFLGTIEKSTQLGAYVTVSEQKQILKIVATNPIQPQLNVTNSVQDWSLPCCFTPTYPTTHGMICNICMEYL